MANTAGAELTNKFTNLDHCYGQGSLADLADYENQGRAVLLSYINYPGTDGNALTRPVLTEFVDFQKRLKERGLEGYVYHLIIIFRNGGSVGLSSIKGLGSTPLISGDSALKADVEALVDSGTGSDSLHIFAAGDWTSGTSGAKENYGEGDYTNGTTAGAFWWSYLITPEARIADIIELDPASGYDTISFQKLLENVLYLSPGGGDLPGTPVEIDLSTAVQGAGGQNLSGRHKLVYNAPCIKAAAPAPYTHLAELKKIFIYFSEDVQNADQQTSYILRGGSPPADVPFTPSYDSGTHTAVLTLTDAWEDGEITVTVEDAVISAGGDQVFGDKTFSFNTDPAGPELVYAVPASGSTVPQGSLGETPIITAAFSGDVTTVSGTIGTDISAVTEYGSDPFAFNSYPLLKDFIFQRLCCIIYSPALLYAAEDLDVPYDPAENRKRKNALPSLDMLFSKPLSAGTVVPANFLIDGDGKGTLGTPAGSYTAAYSGDLLKQNRVTLAVPGSPIDDHAGGDDSVLFIADTTAVKEAAGLHGLAGNNIVVFTADVTGPLAALPIDSGNALLAKYADSDKNYSVLRFSEPVDNALDKTKYHFPVGSGLQVNTITLPDPVNEPLEYLLEITGVKDSSLVHNDTVNLTFENSDLTDDAGNPLATASVQFTVDAVKPKISSTSSSDVSGGVFTSSSSILIKVTYSEEVTGAKDAGNFEALKNGTADGNIVITPGDGDVTDPANTYKYTLNFSAVTLADGDKITFQVKEVGVADLAGNKFEQTNADDYKREYTFDANIPVPDIHDIIAVLDYSGSMEGSDGTVTIQIEDPENPGSYETIQEEKINILRNALEEFYECREDMTDPGENINGVVKFATNVSITQNLADGTPAIDYGIPTGSTALGGGLGQAIQMQNNNTNNHTKEIILFTDGIQNRNPCVCKEGNEMKIKMLSSAEMQSNPWVSHNAGNSNFTAGLPITIDGTYPVYTVGVGSAADSAWIEMLNEISEASRGSIPSAVDMHYSFPSGSFWPAVDTAYMSFLQAICSNNSPKLVKKAVGIYEARRPNKVSFTLPKNAEKAYVCLDWLKGPKLRFRLVKDGKEFTGFRNVHSTGRHFAVSASRPPFSELEDYYHNNGPQSWLEYLLHQYTDLPGTWEIEIYAESESDKGPYPYCLYVMCDAKYPRIYPLEFSRYLYTGMPFRIGLQLKQPNLPDSIIHHASAAISSPKVPESNIILKQIPALQKFLGRSGIKYSSPPKALTEAAWRDPGTRALLGQRSEHRLDLSGYQVPSVLQYTHPGIKIPGINLIEYHLKGHTKATGDFEQTFIHSFLVLPRISFNHSKVSVQKKKGSAAISITPKDPYGNYLGIGYADNISADIPGMETRAVKDQLNGTYIIKLQEEKAKTKAGTPKGKSGSITIAGQRFELNGPY